MHIKWISANKLPPLEYFNLDCDERVNLFVGPNASGKSTILRAIVGLYSLKLDREPKLNPSFPDENFFSKEFMNARGERGSFSLELSDDWPLENPDRDYTIWDLVPILYVPAARLNLPAVNIFDQTIDEVDDDEADAPMKSLYDTESGIFDGQYVERAIKDIRGIQTLGVQLRRAVQIGYSCAKSICSEIIYDDVPYPYVEVRGQESYPPERVVHFDMGIVTTDDRLGEPLYAGALSSGTQGTLLWIWALAINMANRHRWADGWEKKHAILLIDEIENHLHPTWQRRVIPALLEHFPGLQIFATTHSPFVVAGLKAGQVHLLKREEKGIVTATTNPEDVIGWTADEILRNMMGVDDPTDKETAEAARELRLLRSEGPRSDPGEEEKRQARMQELRQRVDRDLLAGGPWKKQREVFEQQFADVLQKYRESQDLNQENR